MFLGRCPAVRHIEGDCHDQEKEAQCVVLPHDYDKVEKPPQDRDNDSLRVSCQVAKLETLFLAYLSYLSFQSWICFGGTWDEKGVQI
jgi:hypothetical protein